MAERALRGTRLGATSYENDRNTDLAPRQEVAFDCPKGHDSRCRSPPRPRCPRTGSAGSAARPRSPRPATCRRRKKAKAPRSHWDMLMERRTLADLEEVLAERLAVIRGAARRPGSRPAGPAHSDAAAQERLSRPSRPASAQPAFGRLPTPVAGAWPHWRHPPQRLGHDGPAHLARAARPLGERDRHLGDGQARARPSAASGRSGSSSPGTRTWSRPIARSVSAR